MARRYLSLATLAFALLCALATPIAADGDDLVLVVHPQSGVETLSRNQVINIYMGRHRQLPSGIAALPVDLAPEREDFYLLLTDKTLAEINAYWARLIFSGRASPPRQAQSTEELLDLVANNRGAIGYVRRSDLNNQVKAVVAVDRWRPVQTAGSRP